MAGLPALLVPRDNKTNNLSFSVQYLNDKENDKKLLPIIQNKMP